MTDLAQQVSARGLFESAEIREPDPAQETIGHLLVVGRFCGQECPRAGARTF